MSNNTTTKTPPPPTAAFPGASNGPSKDSILKDLRRQLDDSDLSSNAGSTSSGRRRRRNRNKNKSALSAPQGLAATAAPVLPRLADTKPVRLQLGLNLDVELELKARIQGDPISVEKKRQKALTAGGKEKKFMGEGTSLEVFEMCYIHLGKFSFRQHWMDREVSKRLTSVVLLGVTGMGMCVGFLSGLWLSKESGCRV